MFENQLLNYWKRERGNMTGSCDSREGEKERERERENMTDACVSVVGWTITRWDHLSKLSAPHACCHERKRKDKTSWQKQIENLSKQVCRTKCIPCWITPNLFKTTLPLTCKDRRRVFFYFPINFANYFPGKFMPRMMNLPLKASIPRECEQTKYELLL